MTLFIIEHGFLCFVGFLVAFSWLMNSGTNNTGMQIKESILGDMPKKSDEKNQIVRSFFVCRA